MLKRSQSLANFELGRRIIADRERKPLQRAHSVNLGAGGLALNTPVGQEIEIFIQNKPARRALKRSQSLEDLEIKRGIIADRERKPLQRANSLNLDGDGLLNTQDDLPNENQELSDIVQKEDFGNWTKCVLGQNKMRAALVPVIEEKFKKYSKKISGNDQRLLKTFVCCLENNKVTNIKVHPSLLKKHGKCKWRCPHNACHKMFLELLSLCTTCQMNYWKIPGDNTSESLLEVHSTTNTHMENLFWEIGKLFRCSASLIEQNASEDLLNLDVAQLIKIMRNCKLFTFDGSDQIYDEILNGRNQLMHSNTNLTTEQEMKKHFDSMTTLLNQNNKFCEALALGKIKKYQIVTKVISEDCKNFVKEALESKIAALKLKSAQTVNLSVTKERENRKQIEKLLSQTTRQLQELETYKGQLETWKKIKQEMDHRFWRKVFECKILTDENNSLKTSKKEKDLEIQQLQNENNSLKTSKKEKDLEIQQLQNENNALKKSELEKTVENQQLKKENNLLKMSEREKDMKIQQLQNENDLLGTSERNKDMDFRQLKKENDLLKMSEREKDMEIRQLKKETPKKTSSVKMTQTSDNNGEIGNLKEQLKHLQSLYFAERKRTKAITKDVRSNSIQYCFSCSWKNRRTEGSYYCLRCDYNFCNVCTKIHLQKSKDQKSKDQTSKYHQIAVPVNVMCQQDRDVELSETLPQADSRTEEMNNEKMDEIDTLRWLYFNELDIKNKDNEATQDEQKLYRFCQKCNQRGKLIEARQYCRDCDKDFCGKCVSSHSSVFVTHQITVPSFLIGNKRYLKVAIKQQEHASCSFHSKSPMNKYCAEHDELCCNTCVSRCHTSCTVKEYPVLNKVGNNA